jgi:hypothetical protein
MKPKTIQFVVVCILLATVTSTFAQGTAFTYQGRLSGSNGPVTGTYDFQFTVRDMPLGGGGVGIFPISVTLPVTNGLFTATIDPGAGVFTGPPRWLEINVRSNGAGAYVTNTPRPQITATPYAVRSANAALASSVAPGSITAASLAPGAVYELSNPSGTISNAVQVSSNGSVGIGTNTPLAALHVAGGQNISAAHLLSVVRDEFDGFTNLSSVYVCDVLGNLLAVGGNEGLSFIDISNPQAPVLLSQLPLGVAPLTNLSSILGVALKTNLAVISGQQGATFLGITNPAAPLKLADLTDGVGGWDFISNVYHVTIRSNLLAMPSPDENAVTLADITDPSNPIKKVEIRDGFFGFNSISGAVSVAFNGNIMAIGAFYENAVTMVDVTDPTSPVRLSEMRDDTGGFNYISNVYRVALSTNGVLAVAAAFDFAVTLVSVTNPAAPVKLAELVDGVNGVSSLYAPTDVAFSGNLLAVTSIGDGSVTLLNVSKPAAPQVLAVARDGMNGFNFLGGAISLKWAGTNLAVIGQSDDAVTLLNFSESNTVGFISQNYVGIGTAQPLAPLHVVGDVFVEGATKFRVESRAIEMGQGASALGDFSIALGNGVLATGYTAVALGSYTEATGDSATAFGNGSKASGFYSVAGGYYAEASGYAAVALGNSVKASGNQSVALGSQTEARGENSFAVGDKTSAVGNYSVALGATTLATNNSMAAGTQARALHEGTFVWADATFTPFNTTTNNQFIIRAQRGVGINTNGTSTNALAVHGHATVNGTLAATNFVGRFSGSGAGLTNVSGPSAANYVFAFDTGSQVVTAPGTFQDVTFSNNGQINGWAHTVSTAPFTCNQSGLYLVEYSAVTETMSAGLSTVSFHAILNAVEVAGSQVAVEPDVAGQALVASRSFIVSASAGNTLTLQFTGTTIQNRIVSSVGSGTTRPAVSMTIVRIQ